MFHHPDLRHTNIVEAETLVTLEKFPVIHFFGAKKSKILSLHVYTTKCAQMSVVYTRPEVS